MGAAAAVIVAGVVIAVSLYELYQGEEDARREAEEARHPHFHGNPVGSAETSCPVGGLTRRGLCNSAIQARVTRQPTPGERGAISRAWSNGDHQRAIDLTCQAYGIETRHLPGGGVTYASGLPEDAAGLATDQGVRINPARLESRDPDALAALIVHETTHYNQYDRMPAGNRTPESFNWAQNRYAEAMAYDAETQAYEQTSGGASSLERSTASERRDLRFNRMSPERQNAFRQGVWPPPEPAPGSESPPPQEEQQTPGGGSSRSSRAGRRTSLVTTPRLVPGAAAGRSL